MENPRSHGSKQRYNRAQARSPPICKTKETKTPKNVRWKSGSSKGGSSKAARCRIHTGRLLPKLARKCSNGQEKEWQVENVHIFHRSQQELSEGRLSIDKNR
jgi:hypothetical protein